MMKSTLLMTGQNAARITMQTAALATINYILRMAGITTICMVVMVLII